MINDQELAWTLVTQAPERIIEMVFELEKLKKMSALTALMAGAGEASR